MEEYQMRKKFLTIFVLLLLPFVSILMAGPPEGQLINTMIPAPSLKNNIFGIPLEQKVAIYLPPSYQDSLRIFPVIYFLPGFSSPVHYFTSWGVFQGFLLKESMDRLIKEGKIQEMIVVIPNGQTFLLGGFFVNSSVTGNWEDFIVKDLVSYLDDNFHIQRAAEARGIAGHSIWVVSALLI
jgi:enterochelin esterase-like enzyme